MRKSITVFIVHCLFLAEFEEREWEPHTSVLRKPVEVMLTQYDSFQTSTPFLYISCVMVLKDTMKVTLLPFNSTPPYVVVFCEKGITQFLNPEFHVSSHYRNPGDFTCNFLSFILTLLLCLSGNGYSQVLLLGQTQISTFRQSGSAQERLVLLSRSTQQRLQQFSINPERE